MPTVYEDEIIFKKAVTFEGEVEIEPEVKRWISQEITTSDLGTSASQSINLADFPTNCIPLGVYVTTAAGDTVAGNTDTTGLAAEVGIATDPDFLMASISVWGVPSRKQGLSGVGLGGLRAADTVQLKLTATGGSPGLDDITGLGLQVHVFYLSA